MKTKALISFAVAAKLICIFVFEYSKSRFSHGEAKIWPNENSEDENLPLLRASNKNCNVSAKEP